MKTRVLPVRIVLGAAERVAGLFLLIVAIAVMTVGFLTDIGHGLRRRGKGY